MPDSDGNQPTLYLSMVFQTANITSANFGKDLVITPDTYNYFPGMNDGMRHVVYGEY